MISVSKKVARLIVAPIVLFAALSVHAAPKKLVFGGESGWGRVESMSGLMKGVGRFGNDAVQLVTSTQATDDSTDLLLTFDGKDVRDSTGHYEVAANGLLHTSDAVRGRGAAVCRGDGHGISLKGDRTSMFGGTGRVGSFTIEFWLAPSLAENGETVFNWRSSLNSRSYSKYQLISASFFSNHIRWKFNNIFLGYECDEVVLDGVGTVVPRKWSRHTLSFDEETGALEYCVDGRTEAILFITDTGHESGTVCEPNLGVAAKIEICPQYTGKIDNFRIDRRFSSRTAGLSSGNEKYKVDGGRLRTKPLLVSHSATLDSLSADMSLPPQTEVRFYVRSGDNCYEWDDEYPEWKEVVPGEKITGVSGLYFQMAAELLPDGGGANTPVVSEITLSYTEQDDPLPPFTVFAEPGDGCVRLSWSRSVDDSAGGYYVYYGNRSGEYLGVVAVEGASPIKVGKRTSLTLSGLKNGTIYYFAVASYSEIDPRICGEFSKEVFARPSARLSKKQ